MGSVSSTNPGLSDLLQTLTNENSPLASTFSSPSVETALENAPPGDIVQLSTEALQLQVTDSLFGEQDTATASPSQSLFSALEAIDSSATNGTGTSTPTLADQLAAYQGSSQLAETQSLLGLAQPTTTTTANSLFDVLA
ncbi:MAG TPA: hypothetical protein VME17_13785 [Bryobacteraceae bacterium]|nr:hypothetical protein [Bryobacteraceae bacterium]